jgi:Protein of unknown function (DUF3276)
MNGKYRSTIGVAVVLLGGLLCGNSIAAQDAPDAPLADQLKKEIKLTKLGTDSTGTSVTDPGTVLVLKKGGVYGVPQSTAVIVAPSTFKDGELHQPGMVQRSMILKISKLLTADEKVYVTKIDVKAKDDKVVLTITECDKCNKVQDPSSYKGAIQFQFPKGYLEKADAGQVADVIHQVLAVPTDADNKSDNNNQQQAQGGDQQQQQGQDQQQQQAPAQAAPAAATTNIVLGMALNDVTTALGQPEKMVNLGKKQIYVYKDLKITFVDGKVTDVQ